MLTRRHILLSAVAAPLMAVSRSGAQIEIITEPHLLAEESAQGYRRALNQIGSLKNWQPQSRLILVPGSRQLTAFAALHLRQLAYAGNWIVLESAWHSLPPALAQSQAGIIRDLLDLHVADRPLSVGSREQTHSYIHYSWPLPLLLRTFEAVTPIQCAAPEVIATFAGLPVCSKQSIGRGGIVFLGSMLGPGLFSEEREAHTLLEAATASF